MERVIKNSTIKKLYGLSGNRCAFPDCDQELVTSNQTIVSEMCHIEGLAPKSARHNPQLTSEQLNDYPNLIVLCLKHHTIIDKEESAYTVEFLKKIKNDHEEKYRKNEFQISNDLISTIGKFYETRQINILSGSGNQIITQNVGITSISDVERLFELLFNENFPKLQEDAQKTAQQCIDKFCKEFVIKAKAELKEGEIKKLADPDIQYVLTKSVIEAGRKNDDELRKNLAHLVVERIKNNDNDLKSKVYNEAIETVGKLTIDGLKIITICFILRYARRTKITHIDELNNFIKLLEPIFDFKNTNAEFQHIVYAGCGELGLGSWIYINTLGESYPDLCPLRIPTNQLVGHNIPSDIMKELFTPINDSEFEFKLINGDELKTYLDSKSIETIIKNDINSHFSRAKQSQTSKVSELIKNSKEIMKANDLIAKSSLKNLTLTSVGIVIGAMYYEKITGEKVPIDIWIN